jgi:hypothetical protein
MAVMNIGLEGGGGGYITALITAFIVHVWWSGWAERK